MQLASIRFTTFTDFQSCNKFKMLRANANGLFWNAKAYLQRVARHLIEKNIWQSQEELSGWGNPFSILQMGTPNKNYVNRTIRSLFIRQNIDAADWWLIRSCLAISVGRFTGKFIDAYVFATHWKIQLVPIYLVEQCAQLSFQIERCCFWSPISDRFIMNDTALSAIVTLVPTSWNRLWYILVYRTAQQYLK